MTQYAETTRHPLRSRPWFGYHLDGLSIEMKVWVDEMQRTSRDGLFEVVQNPLVTNDSINYKRQGSLTGPTYLYLESYAPY